MHNLLAQLTRSLVDHPEQVRVTASPSEHGCSFEIQVAESDLGHVIGKQGRTARSIRILMSAAAAKQKTNFTVNIVTRQL